MSEEKLQAARAHIESGDYQAAKAILETMPDSRTAQRWLAKLPNTPTDEVQLQAEPGKKLTDGSRQGWEYCVIGSMGHIFGDGRMSTYDTVLIRFSSDGEHKTKSKVNIPTMIARLGEEGWEMVGAGTAIALATLTGTDGTLGHVLYFKRPLKE